MVEATEHEKRAVRILCDFGEGLNDAGTGVAIRGGLVLTARHVLYKEESRASSVALVWTYSSDPTPLAVQIAEGCECPQSDLALLCSERPPSDIECLPLVKFARNIPLGEEFLGDGFPIATDAIGSGATQKKCTLECMFISTDEGFMTLRFDERSRFSQRFLTRATPQQIDRAFAGASGTGLFDRQQRLAAIFLARAHINMTDKKGISIATALEKFGSVIFNTPECEKITEEIKEISTSIPGLGDITEMEALAALDEINRVISETTMASCQRLACLVVARACDREEVNEIQTLLDEEAQVIDVLTTKFGGVERRIASAEDRPVAWRDLKADPIAEYRLVDPPDAGIDGVPVGTDFIGAVGVDLNHRLDSPFSGAPENNQQMADLMGEVIFELNERITENEPRYYYAVRYNDSQVDTRAEKVANQFDGLVPFFRLQNPLDANHDRAVLRALLKILKWKPFA